MKNSGLFDELDSFLTNLIIARAPASDRKNLRAWLQPESKRPAPKARKRKISGAMAMA